VSAGDCWDGSAGCAFVVEDLVPDSLWERVAPLLPVRARRRRFPGRKPVDDRVALAGVVFVLKTGISWNELPGDLVGCSGVTCWRRLRDWTEAGVWPALHQVLLAELRAAGVLDLDRCSLDASHLHALKGGTRSARHRSTALTPAPSTT
jgi:transposase